MAKAPPFPHLPPSPPPPSPPTPLHLSLLSLPLSSACHTGLHALVQTGVARGAPDGEIHTHTNTQTQTHQPNLTT